VIWSICLNTIFGKKWKPGKVDIENFVLKKQRHG
jgi:hypothetical protein